MQQGRQASETANSRVTIYDVAEQAGVGIATVSRVLNGTKPVSDKVRSQVRAVVEKLGYVPNRTAKTLAERNRMELAIAVPSFITPFHNELLRGIRYVLKDVDAEMLLKDLGSQSPFSELTHFLKQGVVDGLLLIGAQLNASMADQLRMWHAPAVLVGAPVEGLDSFYWDEVAGGEIATRHLIERGHERIGLIRTGQSIPAQEQRLQGYESALGAAGLPIDETRICSGKTVKHGGFSEESGYEAMQELLALDPPVTAVFASSDAQAIGAWKAVRDAGLDVPNDIAIVGYNDVKASRYIGLSSVSQKIREVGERSAQRLLMRLKQANGAEKISVRIDPVLKVRRTS